LPIPQSLAFHHGDVLLHVTPIEMSKFLSGPIVVRDPVEADYTVLTAIVRGAFKEYESYLAPEAYAQYLDEVVRLELRGSHGQALVAELAGRVVGTASYHHDIKENGVEWPAGWVNLRGLAVEAGARGQGVGRRMIEECAERVRVAGGGALCLHVSEAMAAAALFFDHLGFKRVRHYDLPPAPDPVTRARRSGPWSWAFFLPVI
jgi:GNAT superfamily N-acetyltransferase